MLEADGRAHAYRLAKLSSSTASLIDEPVSGDLQQMMDNVSNAAAYVVNSSIRVSSNRTAAALIGSDQYDRPVEFLFLDPAARVYYLDWNVIARATINGLRFSVGFTPHTPRSADWI